MRVLALDISTSCGWALVTKAGEEIGFEEFGCVVNPQKVLDYGPYPQGYLLAAQDMASKLAALVDRSKPDVVVIEETNGGGRQSSRYTQKVLEFLHCTFLAEMQSRPLYPIKYISTATWRKTLNIKISAEQKKRNSDLSAAKRKAKKAGKSLDKKALGISGKITKKHLSIIWANERFGLELKIKDDDKAEALAIGTAFLMGCQTEVGK